MTWGTYNNQPTAHSWGEPLHDFRCVTVFAKCGQTAQAKTAKALELKPGEERCMVCEKGPSLYVRRRKVSPCDEEAGSTGKVTT